VASRWPLLSALAVSGVGLGLFTVPFFTVALSRVAAHETGSAAGLLNAVQQLGATLGVAVLGSVFLAGHGAATSAVERSFWVALGLVTAAAVAAAIMCFRVRPSVPLGSGGNRRADDTAPARVQEQQDADEPVRGQ
jgi:MFS family permease